MRTHTHAHTQTHLSPPETSAEANPWPKTLQEGQRPLPGQANAKDTSISWRHVTAWPGLAECLGHRPVQNGSGRLEAHCHDLVTPGPDPTAWQRSIGTWELAWCRAV